MTLAQCGPRRVGLWAKAAAIAAAVLAMMIAQPLPVGADVSPEQISGNGSSWAANAINQWVSDVTNQEQVVYNASGSAQGRLDFAEGVSGGDFAVSDIGYQGTNRQTGQNDSSSRPYVYLPMVAGGTAFPYNLVVGGKRVQNLRLSTQTLAKIFTDKITNWDDPEITADNNGRVLPSIPIIPVVHSEGAGTTFQFTDFINTLYPQLWQSFSGYNFPVEFWPTGQGSQVLENGSDGVMNFVASSAGQGSIGFDEYSYALGAGFPVAALENSAGWFTLPDAYNVAVSLTKAQINFDKGSPNYLLETLNDVYTFNDPRDYPLSSYSYLIEPTSANDPLMNTGKRQALANFTEYSICQGQAEMAPIGYSPLPINLVEASDQQVQLLHQADPQVDTSKANVSAVAECHNPTFVAGQPNNNYLADIAPYPPACAESGQGPCPGQYGFNGNPVNGQAGGAGVTQVQTSSSGGSGGTGGSGASGGTGGGTSAGGSSAGGSSAGGSSGGGSSAGGSSGNGGAGSRAAATAAGQQKRLTSSQSAAAATTTTSISGTSTLVGVAGPQTFSKVAAEILAALLLICALVLPPFFIRRRKS